MNLFLNLLKSSGCCRLSKKSFILFHMTSRDEVARSAALRPKKVAPLALRLFCCEAR